MSGVPLLQGIPFFFIFTNSRVSLLYISISVMSCYRGIALSLP